MVRIFLVLALLAVALVAANLMLALVIGDFGASSRAFAESQVRLRGLETSDNLVPDSLAKITAERDRLQTLGKALKVQRERFWPHVWVGIIAALVCLLVNSISVTYFIGTSRWCKEVVEAYQMDPQYVTRSQALKRRTFPWSLLGILTTLAIALLGAAADPYSSSGRPDQWVQWHWGAAFSGTIVLGLAFAFQVKAISANYTIINEILAEAQRMRAEANLEESARSGA